MTAPVVTKAVAGRTLPPEALQRGAGLGRTYVMEDVNAAMGKRYWRQRSTCDSRNTNARSIIARSCSKASRDVTWSRISTQSKNETRLFASGLDHAFIQLRYAIPSVSVTFSTLKRCIMRVCQSVAGNTTATSELTSLQRQALPIVSASNFCSIHSLRWVGCSSTSRI